ncbi:chemotaxis protein CheW [Carboxylicivirga linearis]|uniref:Chemotaxis protein CheW n=1 Tax=Carboxylicivirga linearis TaxID=1628157 RepID=A0ABS5K0J2_9BACT|nr:chemotaxis protein CheW [Carboxylicivirga linearis]MBS2100657.1 chemotaxis protein CheW [Carboxylicivirga linearis]
MNNTISNSYLLFRLQEELFAVSVHKVLEIIETGDEHHITHLPKAASSIAGVVNFRGDVIPVVNSRLKFDMDNYSEGEKFVVIILNLQINEQEHVVGLKADKVVDVIEIKNEDVKPIPEVGQGYNSDYIEGVVNRANKFIMLLNLENAISSNEIVKLKEDTVED